ncbi:hypothetical protein VCRA2111O136_40152 [Vibrio crassostreae]|nr:hypothetical protein VCRA2111O136_40152 [Vibrio crassostreae]CAK3078163.1 hypothetical protein VCRA217O134_50151 [Vibrio crassostreae]
MKINKPFVYRVRLRQMSNKNQVISLPLIIFSLIICRNS